MKANEFIKKFGIEKAKQAVGFGNKYAENGLLRLETFDGDEIDVVIDDLKRLVESHELVNDYYGLARAKEHAESNYTAPELRAALKQAIADVESCQ